jgi:hypothetical protein
MTIVAWLPVAGMAFGPAAPAVLSRWLAGSAAVGIVAPLVVGAATEAGLGWRSGLLVAVALFAAVAAAAASAGSSPSYTITFAGSGTEQHVDHQRNIQDSGLCDSAEHVTVNAALAWTASWRGFRVGKPAGAATAGIAGSAAQGTDVKDACGLDLSQAPPGWVGQANCSAALVPSGSAALEARKTKTALVIGLTAPSLAVPVGAGCALNVRNDQLIAHVAVPLTKLAALKKGNSITYAVGTARPGPGDYYTSSIDCSQPTKPYEGYRTADDCHDTLSWSGAVKITRVS